MLFVCKYFYSFSIKYQDFSFANKKWRLYYDNKTYEIDFLTATKIPFWSYDYIKDLRFEDFEIYRI